MKNEDCKKTFRFINEGQICVDDTERKICSDKNVGSPWGGRRYKVFKFKLLLH